MLTSGVLRLHLSLAPPTTHVWIWDLCSSMPIYMIWDIFFKVPKFLAIASNTLNTRNRFKELL